MKAKQPGAEESAPVSVVSAFVLTGGASARMGPGRDKALLELGGRPLVLRTCDLAARVAGSVARVGAPERYRHLGLPVLADSVESKGPLSGIVTALRSTQTGWNLVLACDLPYLDSDNGADFLSHMIGLSRQGEDFDAVVPETYGGWPRSLRGWQPLCALYHRRCLPAFERVLAAGHPKITLAFEELRVRAVSEAGLGKLAFPPRIFENMNTPEEYEQARRYFETIRR